MWATAIRAQTVDLDAAQLEKHCASCHQSDSTNWEDALNDVIRQISPHLRPGSASSIIQHSHSSRIAREIGPMVIGSCFGGPVDTEDPAATDNSRALRVERHRSELLVLAGSLLPLSDSREADEVDPDASSSSSSSSLGIDQTKEADHESNADLQHQSATGALEPIHEEDGNVPSASGD